MKTKLITILLLVTVSGFAQRNYFPDLDWCRTNVKAQNRDLQVVYQSKEYIEYKIPGGFIAYTFEKRRCIEAQLCMDSVAGVQFIQQSLAKNWRAVAPGIYDYHTGSYVYPVTVTADWAGGNVIFSYKLKPEENENRD